MKKHLLYIAIILLAISCRPSNNPTIPTVVKADSIFTKLNIQAHGDYYHSQHQVYSIDLLSDGLDFDSAGYIVGSGYNLYLSDIFAASDCTTHLPAGTYTMDSTAKEMTFLHGMHFDGDVTGTYLLDVKENQIQRIILFTGGTMTVDYINEDTILEFNLYLSDSTIYRASYTGYAN